MSVEMMSGQDVWRKEHWGKKLARFRRDKIKGTCQGKKKYAVERGLFFKLRLLITTTRAVMLGREEVDSIQSGVDG